jgi:hypothetical protein
MSNTEWLDDPADSLEDREFPDEDELDDDLSQTVTCPECGADVYEDTPRCPHCGNYLGSPTHAITAGRGWWFALGIIGILAALAVLIIGGFW